VHFARFDELYWENNFIKADSYYYYYPLFVLDVSKQTEKFINSKPDIKIKVTFSKKIPDETMCYCLILSDSVVKIKDRVIIN
jgi:hypothetical protein